jgi:hypothetical protein
MGFSLFIGFGKSLVAVHSTRIFEVTGTLTRLWHEVVKDRKPRWLRIEILGGKG